MVNIAFKKFDPVIGLAEMQASPPVIQPGFQPPGTFPPELLPDGRYVTTPDNGSGPDWVWDPSNPDVWTPIGDPGKPDYNRPESRPIPRPKPSHPAYSDPDAVWGETPEGYGIYPDNMGGIVVYDPNGGWFQTDNNGKWVWGINPGGGWFIWEDGEVVDEGEGDSPFGDRPNIPNLPWDSVGL